MAEFWAGDCGRWRTAAINCWVNASVDEDVDDDSDLDCSNGMKMARVVKRNGWYR